MSTGASSLNGAALTLSLVGALAVGAALGRRGSRASAETLYHGSTEEVRVPRAGTFLTPDPQTASTYARYGPNQSKRIPQDGVVSSYSLDPKASVQTFRSFADAYAHYGVRSSQALARTAVQRREADVVAVYDERILVHPSVVNWIGSEPVAGEGSRATNLPSTPAFRRWFGESKVVDEAGRPLVVFHGTGATFDTFDKKMRGFVTESSDSKTGFFFTSSLQRAEDAAQDAAWMTKPEAWSRPAPDAARVMRVYLKMERPLVRYDMQDDPADTARIIRAAKRAGHDGLIWMQGERGGRDYVVFEPTQIKSATGNRGTFDPADPRISYNRSAR